MSNPTTPFSWQMPTNTDLVTDLPADFEVFGQAVATSMADLLGGTTGQILSKATNTDMDFVWIANDQGDITGVTATSPLTGGGTSGAITVGIQSASTSQSGAVQLSDSTSTTSSVLAATPTAVKSAFDTATTANTTANAAIPKSTVTTAGDVIYGTGSSTVTRLGIGTAGQVLTVNSGATAPSWATPSSGGGLTLITETVASANTSIDYSSISGTYTNLQLQWTGIYHTAASSNFGVRLNSDSGSNYNSSYVVIEGSSPSGVTPTGNNTTCIQDVAMFGNQATSTTPNQTCNGILTIFNYASTTKIKKYECTYYYYSTNNSRYQYVTLQGYWNSTAALTSINIFRNAGTAGLTNLTNTSIRLYGVK